MAKRLTYFILAALVLGIITGWILNAALGGGNHAARRRDDRARTSTDAARNRRSRQMVRAGAG